MSRYAHENPEADFDPAVMRDVLTPLPLPEPHTVVVVDDGDGDPDSRRSVFGDRWMP